jgi:hypothetical protein
MLSKRYIEKINKWRVILRLLTQPRNLTFAGQRRSQGDSLLFP